MGRRRKRQSFSHVYTVWKCARLLIGLLLIPAAAAAVTSSYKVISVLFNKALFFWPLLAGAAIYLLFMFINNRLGNKNDIFYVLAHELSHALLAVFSGAKIFSIKIKKQSGNVKLSRSNFLIGLAPYFLPLYAIITTGLYYICAYIFPHVLLRPWFTGAVGFFLAFHFAHTLEMLAGPLQPDLRDEGGIIFSFPVIIFLSCLTTLLVLLLMLPSEISLKAILLTFAYDQKVFYAKAVYLLKYLYHIVVKSL